jgi:mono/diheme cytochrome c family protein
MKNSIIISFCLLVLASCFAKKQAATNATLPKKDVSVGASTVGPEMQVAKAEPRPAESTLANSTAKTLLQGKALYQTKCNQCHDLKNEKSESEKGWRYHVPEMVDMSNNAGKIITQEESNLILTYLLDAIKE